MKKLNSKANNNKKKGSSIRRIGKEPKETKVNKQYPVMEPSTDSIEPREIKKKCGHDLDDGCTLFLRNIPYDSTIDDITKGLLDTLSKNGIFVEDSIEEYGQNGTLKKKRTLKLKMEKSQLKAESDSSVTRKQKVSNCIRWVKLVGGGVHASRGTAFVKTVSENIAEKLISLDWLDSREKIVVDSLRNIEGIGVQVNGRRIVIMRGESSNALKKLKNEREDKESQNLHLLKEGYIDPSSEEFKELPEKVKELRNESWKDRKAKLLGKRKSRINGKFFINPFRLCIRYINPSIQKASFAKFVDSVLRGEDNRKTISKDVTSITLMMNKLDKNEMKRNCQRKSKGYGFVTFSTKDSALKALRILNNKKMDNKIDRPLIVEFSIENSVAIKKHEERVGRTKQSNSSILGHHKNNKSSDKVHSESSHKCDNSEVCFDNKDKVNNDVTRVLRKKRKDKKKIIKLKNGEQQLGRGARQRLKRRMNKITSTS